MEIEIRTFIDNIASFKKKLVAIKAKPHSKKHIIDYYFCTKESTKFEQVQQQKAGSYALRIRKSIKDDETVVEMNCKVLEKTGDHNAFHEYETKVEDFEQAKLILEKVGFRIFCIVDKKRTIYKYGECSINIEDIKGFRPAVELEIISEDEANHKQTMRDILDKLGIKQEDRIEKSITFLYMKEHSFKD